MKEKFLIAILLSTFLLAGLIFFIYKNSKKDQVCFKNNCFKVELARTEEEWVQGLMFRKSLEQDRGMLFIFPEEEIHSFWMKDTLIPLDIIWVNENKEVVFISENTQPCKEDTCPLFGLDKPAKYVLEINAGISKEIGLKVEDRLAISLNEK